MSDLSSDDLSRLTDYIAGELPPHEAAAVRGWIAADATRQTRYEALRHAHESLRARPASHVDMPALLAQLAQLRNSAPTTRTTEIVHTDAAHTSAAPRRTPRTRPITTRRWPVFAATAIATACVLAAIGLRTGSSGRTVASDSRVYRTTVGQRATVTLDDGTHVTLGPSSTLRVAAGFGQDERLVTLEGEALLDVTTGSHAPFIVRTASIDTRVLGTTFAVRRYATDVITRVAVVTGKVAVTARSVRHPSVTLAAGMVGRVDDSSATSVIADNIAQYTTWTEGRLVFQDTPLPEVLATLARWHDIEFRLADSALARERVTMSVDPRALRDAFTTMQRLLNIELKTNGRVTTLMPSQRAPRESSAPRTTTPFSSPSTTEVGR